MENSVSTLTKEGIFFILGKLYYTEALLESRFDDETTAPVGVEQALSEIEEAKEPLLCLLLGPPDIRHEFLAYLKSTHELEIDIMASPVLSTENELVTTKPRLSVVKKDDGLNPPK